MSIKRMIVNGFIKAFTFANFEAFVKMIGFENKISLFFNIQQKNIFKHAFIEKDNTEYFETFGFKFAIN